MPKQKKGAKNQQQQSAIEHLTEAEKYQAVVDLIGKMIVDITFKEFEEERTKISLLTVYCQPCLSIAIYKFIPAE